MKHVPSKKTDVLNLIRGILSTDLIIPKNPHMPLVNLGLGKIKLKNKLIIVKSVRGTNKGKWLSTCKGNY